MGNRNAGSNFEKMCETIKGVKLVRDYFKICSVIAVSCIAFSRWHGCCYKIVVNSKKRNSTMMVKKTVVNKQQKGGTESVDWNRLQSWLQEAATVLDYCTLLAAGKRTGDIEGALEGHDCFKMQFIADDMEISDEVYGEYRQACRSRLENQRGFPVVCID